MHKAMKTKQVIERMPLIDESEGEDEQFDLCDGALQQNRAGHQLMYQKARHDSRARQMANENIDAKIHQQHGSLTGMIRPESLTRMNNKAGALAERDLHDLNWESKEARNAKAAEMSDTLLDGSNLANLLRA